MKQVLIIGGGLGALCCGIRLLAKGYQVSIYEKEAQVGGVIKTLPNAPFLFDSYGSIGIHPKEYAKVFTDTGLDPHAYFEATYLDELYRVFYGRDAFTLKANLYENKSAFKYFYKEDFAHYANFITTFYNKYLLADEAVLSRAFIEPSDTFCPYTLASLIKLNPLRTAKKAIAHYVHSPKAQVFLAFQTLYMGLVPQRLSQLYATVPAATQMLGLTHIKGGMGTYIKALQKAFTDLGGQIFCNSPVTKILTHHNTVYGILVKQKKVLGDYIISNADYAYTYSKLLNNTIPKTPFKKLPTMTYSVFMLHLGLATKLPMLSTHNFYISSSFNHALNMLNQGLLATSPPIYIYYPAAVDESFCINQNVSLNMMIRVPNLSSPHIKWTPKLINHLSQICIKTLAQMTGIPNIADFITYQSTSTPVDLKRDFNCTHGAAFGPAPTFFQNPFVRPQIRSKDFENLYFVGSSIHPGNGISIVMKGAKLTASCLPFI